MVQVEVWVMVDASGEYQAGKDADDAAERYAEENDAGSCTRLVRVLVDVPFSVPTLKGTAPPEGEAALVVA